MDGNLQKDRVSLLAASWSNKSICILVRNLILKTSMDLSHRALLNVFVIPGSLGNTTDVKSKYFLFYISGT